LYQHEDSLGLVHCNSNHPAVVQGNVCDTVQYTEKITLIISNSSLPSVSLNTTSSTWKSLSSAAHASYKETVKSNCTYCGLQAHSERL